MGSTAAEKPHAVCVPFPAQGHVNPMLKLAKLLHFKGFHITFVNTEFNHQRIVNSSTGPSAVEELNDFRFETIPDGLPPDHGRTQDVPSLSVSVHTKCFVPFRNLITKLMRSESDVPPITCIVADSAANFGIEIAQELGIPDVAFWTTSACGFMAYLHFPHLIQRGLVPLKDMGDVSNGYLDAPIDWVPGMKNMRMKDFPSFIRTTDPNDIMLHALMDDAQITTRASKIILNTYDELERPILELISSMMPCSVYTIGPLSLLSHQMPESPLASVGSSLWKEELGCLEWLEGREPASVFYVNFGSITTMSKEEVIEFAWGLANSNYDFLWVIRPDLVKGDSAVLPQDFLTETKERGLLASWCSQEQVLMHPSVGGFLTHNGWNSTIESISGGVPMICWPFFADQQTNCRFACTEWGNGMEIDNNVKREEVEGLIRELMGGEKGKEMRRKALEWKEGAVRATKPGGSSFTNLEKVVSEVLALSKSI